MVQEGNKTLVKLKALLHAALVSAAGSKYKFSSLLGDSEQVFWEFNYQNGLYGTTLAMGQIMELSKGQWPRVLSKHIHPERECGTKNSAVPLSKKMSITATTSFGSVYVCVCVHFLYSFTSFPLIH